MGLPLLEDLFDTRGVARFVPTATSPRRERHVVEPDLVLAAFGAGEDLELEALLRHERHRIDEERAERAVEEHLQLSLRDAHLEGEGAAREDPVLRIERDEAVLAQHAQRDALERAVVSAEEGEGVALLAGRRVVQLHLEVGLLRAPALEGEREVARDRTGVEERAVADAA